MRVLDKVLCICYPVQFRKDNSKDVLALLGSGNELNLMILVYTAHLDFKVRVTNVDAQRIDGSSLATYGIVIAAFQVVNKLDYSWFF